MSEDNQLIILRFRDIGLPAGDTIKEHRRVIGRYGHCWWGWLYREYERNAHDAILKIFADKASVMPVALYDTGQSRIYVANCDQVKAYSYARRSPMLDSTPGYYNNRAAPAWFRFTEITDSTDQAVVGRRCVALPSASDECFTDLLGKRIEHIRDLRRQEVTMWVVQ